MPNALLHARSPYLRAAADQPVSWFAWGDDAFARARAEGKPVLLDIGAVWCHWCHVMDGESYESEVIARIINSHFIAIKVDRDERPDVDARYQRAVQAMTGQGGWPLTVFLTPDGAPFYGGTYFPPDNRYNRPGFAQVLHAAAEAFADRRAKVEEQAEAITRHLAASNGDQIATILSAETVHDATSAIVAAFDDVHGGFGDAPKFPHASTIEFLIGQHARTGGPALKDIVLKTLLAMGQGGIRDQLGGGFHRYSTDARWVVPHFEKMLYDNAELLRANVHAYAAFENPELRRIAEDTIRWMNDVLADREHGGFGGSQDADVRHGDDGSYFTWREDDARSVLTPDEWAVARLHYNIYADGEMHHDPSQNVLFVDRSPAAIAESLGLDEAAVDAFLVSARTKLFASRCARVTPFVDPTVYVGWNALAISAFLDAAAVFGRDDCEAFAIRTLDRILREGIDEHGAIRHTLAPASAVDLLDDVAFLISALFRAFEATGLHEYLQAAISGTRRAIERLYDGDGKGFFDRPREAATTGMMNVPIKPVLDSPTPGGNAVMCRNLVSAYRWTNDRQFLDCAHDTLQMFAATTGRAGLYASEYFSALDEFFHPPRHVMIVGDSGDQRTLQLRAFADRHRLPAGTVTQHLPGDDTSLPPSLRNVVHASAEPAAFVCEGTQCSMPCTTEEQLRVLLHA